MQNSLNQSKLEENTDDEWLTFYSVWDSLGNIPGLFVFLIFPSLLASGLLVAGYYRIPLPEFLPSLLALVWVLLFLGVAYLNKKHEELAVDFARYKYNQLVEKYKEAQAEVEEGHITPEDGEEIVNIISTITTTLPFAGAKKLSETLRQADKREEVLTEKSDEILELLYYYYRNPEPVVGEITANVEISSKTQPKGILEKSWAIANPFLTKIGKTVSERKDALIVTLTVIFVIMGIYLLQQSNMENPGYILIAIGLAQLYLMLSDQA